MASDGSIMLVNNTWQFLVRHERMRITFFGEIICLLVGLRHGIIRGRLLKA